MVGTLGCTFFAGIVGIFSAQFNNVANFNNALRVVSPCSKEMLEEDCGTVKIVIMS